MVGVVLSALTHPTRAIALYKSGNRSLHHPTNTRDRTSETQSDRPHHQTTFNPITPPLLKSQSIRDRPHPLRFNRERTCGNSKRSHYKIRDRTTAHKLARIFYRLWTSGGDYQDPGMDYYEQLTHERVINNLHKKALALGFELVPQPEANTVS